MAKTKAGPRKCLACRKELWSSRRKWCPTCPKTVVAAMSECQAPSCQRETERLKPYCIDHALLFSEQAKNLFEAEAMAIADVLAHRPSELVIRDLETTVEIDFDGEVSLEWLAEDSHYFSEITPTRARLGAIRAQIKHSEFLIITKQRTVKWTI